MRLPSRLLPDRDPICGRTLWLAALVGMLVFAVTLGGTYIYDDVPIALQDVRLRQPGLWYLYLTRDYNYDHTVGDGSVDNLYRPWVSLSFAVQSLVHGHRPWLLHAVNLALFGGCCATVARLGQRLGGGRAGLLAGVGFAVHPVHAEAVCALVGRAELVALLGMVGAINLQLGGRPSARRTAGILALLVLALGSKEQGMLLPPLLLLAEWVRRQRSGPETPVEGVEVRPGRFTPLSALLLGVCGLTAGYIVLREQVLGLKFWWDRSFLDPAVQPMIWATGADRALMPLVLLGRYVGQLFWPGHLSFDYSGKVIGWTVSQADPALWIGVGAAAVGLIGVAVAVARRAWGALLLLVGFGLTYGVISNAVSLIGVNYAERLIFIPSALFIVLLAWGLARVLRGRLVWVLVLPAALMAVHAGVYASRWNDREAFYAWSLANEPKSMRLHQLVADELTKAGRLDEAAEVAARGRATMPEYFAIWSQSGLIEEMRGRWDEADRLYAEAARLNPQTSALDYLAFKNRRAQAGAMGPTTMPATGRALP